MGISSGSEHRVEVIGGVEIGRGGNSRRHGRALHGSAMAARKKGRNSSSCSRALAAPLTPEEGKITPVRRGSGSASRSVGWVEVSRLAWLPRREKPAGTAPASRLAAGGGGEVDSRQRRRPGVVGGGQPVGRRGRRGCWSSRSRLHMKKRR